MKNILKRINLKYWGAFGAGLLWGAAIVFLAGAMWLRTSLVKEERCKYGLEETIKKIVEKGKENKAWTMRPELCASPKTSDNCAIRVVKLCNPTYAAEMLDDPDSRKVSAIIPCTFSIYEKPDGRTYLSRLNSRLVGLLLGGAPGRVFPGKVTPDQNHFLEDVIEK